MQLNDWQKTVARAYGGGDYAHFADAGEITNSERDSCGDTLFAFLMIELSDREDCDSLEEAIRRVRSARDQLDETLNVLGHDTAEPLSAPAQFDETVQRKSDHFEALLGILKILAASPTDLSFNLDFWRTRANAAIAKAEAILAGAPDPE